MLSASGLKSSIWTKLSALGFHKTGWNEKYIDAIAEAVVEHIKENGEVLIKIKTGSSAGPHEGGKIL